MVLETSKTFPALLGDPEAQRQLEGFVVAGMPAGFLEAEIVNRAGPEVANKIRYVCMPITALWVGHAYHFCMCRYIQCVCVPV